MFDPPLCIGIVILKGARKYVGGDTSRPALFLEASTSNVEVCYVSHLYLSLTAPVL